MGDFSQSESLTYLYRAKCNRNVISVSGSKYFTSLHLPHYISNVITFATILVGSPPGGAVLTHWGWVTHICIRNPNIIVSDNGVSHGRCRAIIWTNVRILLIWHLGTNISEILITIHKLSFKKMHFKMSIKWRPFCLPQYVHVLPSIL